MRPTTRGMIAMLGVMAVAVPAVASGGESTVGGLDPATVGRATFYELTENMKLIQKSRREQTIGRRIATSALTGLASPGTPLCPTPDLQSGELGCAVNILGRDNVSLLTGQGSLEGSFATVIQGDNPVDGPEAVVLRGRFQGKMDFSPAILLQIPYGTVTGRVTAQRGRTTSFTGIFRLPFAGNVVIEVQGDTKTLREVFCPLSPDPNPNAPLYGGVDLAYLDFDATTPNGKCLDIQPTELSLGAPLVRFDITF